MTHERVAKHAASQSGAAQLVPVARTNAERFPDVFRVSSLNRSRLFPTRSTSDLECVLAKTKEKEIRHETTESTEMVWRGLQLNIRPSEHSIECFTKLPQQADSFA